MSPFRSLKNNITNSFSSVRAVEGLEPANDLRIGDTNAHETWTYAGRRYYAFTESGYFDVTVSGKADIAIIGGGGSGGSGRNNFACGGGGGAGAFVEYYDVTLPTGNYFVIIGNGGVGRVPGLSNYSTNGSASKLTGPPTFSGPTPSHHPAANIIQAPGGGSGGTSQVSPSPYFNVAGSNGGSGGGSVAAGVNFGSGEYEKGWGHPGSNGPGGSAGATGAGGGGGAGGTTGHDAYYVPNGVPSTNSNPPINANNYMNADDDYGFVGGGGKYMFGGDAGIPTNYGTPGPNPGRYFAGGGDGATDQTTPTSGVSAPGGGAHELSPTNSHDGLKNTGGGGGGSYHDTSGPQSFKAGDGGSGIMIMRFEYH